MTSTPFITSDIGAPLSPFTLRDQTCVNTACELYHQPTQGNVVVHSRKWRRFQCTVCKRSWVAHRNTIRYRLRSAPQTIEQAVDWLTHGLSIRLVARRLRVSPSTVLRWKKKIQVSTFKSIFNI